MLEKINYLDLFSGIGGFHKGLEEAGIKFNWTGYSEIDKYAKQIYKKQFPKSEDLGDVKDVANGTFRFSGKLDLITFGFPCQDLSIAGRRSGIKSSRSGLFFEAMRIIRAARPNYFIFENVKGLFSSNNRQDWITVLQEVADSGYDGQWQLLNTRWFLPQNRERVYFVGHIRGECRPKVFPIREGNKVNDSSGQKKEGQRWSCCLGTRYGQRWIDESYIRLKQIGHLRTNAEGYRVYDSEGIARTIMKDRIGLYRVAPTIRAEHHNTADVHFVSGKAGIRRLTPTECERLQGFPDGWTEGLSDTQRYKCLGNAVSVPVVKAIGERLQRKPI